MKKIILSGLLAGAVLFVLCYGGLYLGIRLFPLLFLDYNSPMFNSAGNRNLFFYLHPFVISLALAWFWERFKGLFYGHYLLRGLEFGSVYALISLLPVFWITFSTLDISLLLVLSWFLYGFFQSVVAGILFARFRP